MTESTTIKVDGMECENCVQAVTQALGSLPGVTGVQVDLAAGRARIEHSAPIATEAVKNAVEDAGFDLAGTVL